MSDSTPHSNNKFSLTHHQLVTSDGTSLHHSHAKQPLDAPLIVFVHGYSEHSRCYEDVMAWFYQRGYHVASYDVRGHGTSSGQRGYVDSYDTYNDDLHCVLKQLHRDCSPTRTQLIAHSNGGLIVAHYLLKQTPPIPIDNVVLSAPYFALHAKLAPPRWLQTALKGVNRFYKHLSIPKRSNSLKLTHDPTKQAFINSDPLRLKSASVRWFVAANEAQRHVINNAHRWSGPGVLLLLADEDYLADNAVNEQFFQQIPITQKHCIHYPGMYHELLNETIATEIYQAIYDWLEQQSQ